MAYAEQDPENGATDDRVRSVGTTVRGGVSSAVLVGSLRDVLAVRDDPFIRERCAADGEWRRAHADLAVFDEWRVAVAPGLQLSLEVGHRALGPDPDTGEGAPPGSIPPLNVASHGVVRIRRIAQPGAAEGRQPDAAEQSTILLRRVLSSANGRLRLVADEPDAIVRALDRRFVLRRREKILLAPSMSVRDALTMVLETTARRIGEVSPLVEATRAPAALHQLRVALRRFRANERALRKPAQRALTPLALRAKAIAAIVAPARDWDVFLDDQSIRADLTAYTPMGAERIFARASALRAAAWTDAHRITDDATLDVFALDLTAAARSRSWFGSEDLDAPIANIAARLLDKRLAAAARIAATLQADDLDSAHALRIEMKKLRYTAQTFRTLYPGDARKAYMASMASMQDIFGQLNDSVVAGRLVAMAAAGQGEAAARGAGFLAGMRAEQARNAAMRLRDLWAAFAAQHPFWL